jgi:hypothetical protein
MASFEPGTARVSIVQGAYHVEELSFVDGDNNNAPIDLAALYDAIECNLREDRRKDSVKIKGLTLSSGITITNTNVLNLDLTNESDKLKYYGDIRFRLTGTSNWVTLVTLDCTNTLSVTKV